MSWQTTIFLMFIWSLAAFIAYTSHNTSVIAAPLFVTMGFGIYKILTLD